jgi:hypothetical protein
MHINERVRKHRQAKREAGLRLVQLWVPDTRSEGFDEECRRQTRLAAEADRSDAELGALMDDALQDLDGWTN